jgi:hypothetical protein
MRALQIPESIFLSQKLAINSNRWAVGSTMRTRP